MSSTLNAASVIDPELRSNAGNPLATSMIGTGKVKALKEAKIILPDYIEQDMANKFMQITKTTNIRETYYMEKKIMLDYLTKIDPNLGFLPKVITDIFFKKYAKPTFANYKAFLLENLISPK